MKVKLRVIFGIVLCLIICCALFVGCNDKEKGTETEILPAETIKVGTAEELVSVAKYVGVKYSNYTIELTADIDLSGVEWKPIGTTLNNAFCGKFDGKGKTISGLKIKGWESDGTPLYIAKQILGTLADGTPVYKSSEIIDITCGEQLEEEIFAVNEIVYEGDDADKNYLSIADGNGSFETEASYGSVGLFGYTRGATIKNLNVTNADISFYTSGDFSYAGIISGYDIASTFENVEVDTGKIAVSTIYENVISYSDYYGTPEKLKAVNNNKQYVGGIVGYAKGKTALNNGKQIINKTTFKDINCNNFSFDNSNFCAYYCGGIANQPYGSKGDAKLVVDKSKEKGYIVTKVNPGYSVVGLEQFPVLSYIGGAIGYGDNVCLDTVSVDGFNRAVNANEGTNKLSEYKEIISRSTYAGGLIGGMYSSVSNDSSTNDVFINGIYWRIWDIGSYVGLIYDKATIGGAYGIVSNSEIKNGKVNNLYAEVGGTSLEYVCMGGFIGYADDSTIIDQISIQKAYMYSTYSVSDGSELGSVMGGAVAVLRNSSLKNAVVKGIDFEINGNLNSYGFVRNIVSQSYGNSFISNSTAENMRIHNSTNNRNEFYGDGYEENLPIEYKNNYVNEDGYTSARLYYKVNNKVSDVYVTVYGEIIPRDSDNNLLIEEKVYKKVDLSNKYTNGQIIANDKYYYYNPTTSGYIFIWDETVEKYKKYSDSALYAEKVSYYKVEFSDKNKNAVLQSGKYWEYSESEAKMTLTKDTKAQEGKTYYVEKKDEYISSYYLDITVYSESGNVLVINEKEPDNENDDVLAKARYALTKNEVKNAETTKEYGDIVYVLANAEVYLDNYFATGTGFKSDINGFTIKIEGVENRDFAKYVIVTGRPITDVATIQYIK